MRTVTSFVGDQDTRSWSQKGMVPKVGNEALAEPENR